MSSTWCSDSRLPVRLSQLSDRPEGTPDNPLQPDLDIVGTINTKRGPLELVLERHHLPLVPGRCGYFRGRRWR